MFLLPQFTYVLLQNRIGFREIFPRQMRDRELQDLWLKQRADGKQFSDVAGRQGRDDGAPVGNDGDQAFGIQLTESFPDRDAADLVLRSDGILTKLRSLRNLAANDLIA